MTMTRCRFEIARTRTFQHGDLLSMNHPTVLRVVTAFLILGLTGGYSAVLAAETAPTACSTDSRYFEQDFTLGDWDVYEKGQKSASVHLEKVLNGCAIQETWAPVGGGGEHGIGLFTYSRILGHWGYFWVADNGQTTAFIGDQRTSNEMLYITYAPIAGGGRKERHWTLALQSDGSHTRTRRWISRWKSPGSQEYSKNLPGAGVNDAIGDAWRSSAWTVGHPIDGMHTFCRDH